MRELSMDHIVRRLERIMNRKEIMMRTRCMEMSR